MFNGKVSYIFQIKMVPLIAIAKFAYRAGIY